MSVCHYLIVTSQRFFLLVTVPLTGMGERLKVFHTFFLLQGKGYRLALVQVVALIFLCSKHLKSEV